MPASFKQSEPYRIAIVATELRHGGAEQCLVRLALGLDRARFAPTVFSLADRPVGTRAGLVEQLDGSGVPVHFVGVRFNRQYRTAVRRLRDALAARRPDLMHAFLFHATVVGVAAARAAGVPRIVSGIRVADPSRWRLWLQRRLASRIDRFACVSDSVAHFSHSTGRLPPEKTVVIPNGVDANRLSDVVPVESAELGVDTGRRILLAMGRFERQKGFDRLIGVAPQILAALPQHDLVLVGEGRQRAKLELLARKTGHAERIHLLPWSANPAAVMAAADLLIVPSRYEGMPNVLLEAMAVGCPAVAADVEGVTQLLGPAAAGQTVPRDDVAALADRVIRLAEDTRAREHLGRQNRDRARRFSIESMIDAYGRLYESIL